MLRIAPCVVDQSASVSPSVPNCSERIRCLELRGAVSLRRLPTVQRKNGAKRSSFAYQMLGGNSICYRRREIPRVRAIGGEAGNQSTFLSYEEAGLIEMSKLDMHERFLCRLTVSSLNLLRIISEQEGVPIEELNAGRICDWFQNDKVKREQDTGSATLKWDSGPEW